MEVFKQYHQHSLEYIRIAFCLLMILKGCSAMSQEYFEEKTFLKDDIMERHFFESMDQYIPDERQNGTESFIRDMDPSFLQDWVSWIMDEAMIPGVSLCFLKDGELYWKTHLGLSNVGMGSPVNDSTIFLTASISKTIVLTAIMQLYEQEYFELDDNVNDYLPFEVQNPNHPDSNITFRHLMTHLSSIADDNSLLNSLVTFGYDSNIPLGVFLSGYLVEDGMYFTPQNYLSDPPETTYEYSNVGISLLAYIVEVMTGTDYETYCQQYIFGPLGMDQSSFRLANLDQSLIATPYINQGDTLVPSLHPGFPVYPSGTLRSSAVNLSKVLSMYMNDGSLNQIQILEESTIDLITTLQYPELLYPDHMGLIWFFKYGFFKHGGFFPGAQAEYGFSWDKRSGMLCIGNSANSDWSWFMEFLLVSYAYHYKPFSIQAITIDDTDEDNLLEPGEETAMTLSIRNNINVTANIPEIQLQLISYDPNILITLPVSSLGNMNYLETRENSDIPFLITIGKDQEAYATDFNLIIEWGEDQVYQTYFRLDIGNPDILLVNDGTSFGGLFVQPKLWYENVLDSLGHQIYHYDMTLFGDPEYGFISNFPIVIWFTGLQSEATLTDQNQEVLLSYLENGGNLFLSGQNLSEDLQQSAFLTEILHVKHLNSTYSGQDTLLGTSGDPIGNDLFITINQGWDALYQASMSEIEPVDGGEVVLSYYSTGTGAAVRYEGPTYKTVFFSFGFEGINEFGDRIDVMKKILEYFNETVAVDDKENPAPEKDFEIFPNPFQNHTVISYFLRKSGPVCLKIFDLNGHLVHFVDDEYQLAGSHLLSSGNSNLIPGIYFYYFSDGEIQQSGKLILSR